jgi:hypothetical protein
MSDQDNFTGNPFADEDNFTGDPFAGAGAGAPLTNRQILEQNMGASDFTKSFASTPARMLKSAMQMVGAGNYVPDAVSNAAAEGDKSLAGRIVGDVAGTGGLRAGANYAVTTAAPGLVNAIHRLNAAKGILPAAGRVAESAAYGGAQGAITTPDDQANAAKWGAAGGAAGGVAVPALVAVLRGTGRFAANVLGGTTGAGSESVKQAFNSADNIGQVFKTSDDFSKNMRGQVALGEVVEQARAGIQNMRSKMHETYLANRETWKGDKKLDITPIREAYNGLVESLKHEDFYKIGPAEQNVVKEMLTILDDFGGRKSMHTTEGFDALKQRLQAIYPESPQMKQAQRAVATMANVVKDSISAQNPTYASSMSQYWNAARELDEIERSLSLGNKATTDTALRKLQSLMRNNVNSNFGQRVQSANKLATQGGQDVLPAVAGQAMNDWLPRGIGRGVGAATIPPAVFSGGLGIPAAIASGAVQSPRLVGESARLVGGAVNDPYTQTILRLLRRSIAPATFEQTRDDQP